MKTLGQVGPRAIGERVNAAKKSDPSKSLDFVPGPFKILKIAPFSDFQGLI